MPTEYLVPALDGSQIKATPLKFAVKFEKQMIFVIYSLDHLHKKFCHEILINFDQAQNSDISEIVENVMRAHTLYVHQSKDQIHNLVTKLYEHKYGRKVS
jgi:hypothetical protein